MERITLPDAKGLGMVLERATSVLQRSGLIIYPTDTLYGLGADACNETAIQKVFDLKGREEQKPLSVLVADIAMAEQYVEVTPFARRVMERLLPGPYTVLLPRKNAAPDLLVANGPVLGIRMPDSELCRELPRSLGRPVTSTSANKSGDENRLTVDGILEQLGEAKASVDLIVDGGALKESLGSTVIDLSDGSVRIVREGDVSKEHVFEVTETIKGELS